MKLQFTRKVMIVGSIIALAVITAAAPAASARPVARHGYYPSCAGIKHQVHPSASQVAAFRRQAQGLGFSKHAVDVVVHCHIENRMPTSIALGSGYSTQVHPPSKRLMMETSQTTTPLNRFCPRNSSPWSLKPETVYINSGVYRQRMLRFSFSTAVCYRWVKDNGHWFVNIVKAYSPTQNNNAIRPHVYGWAALWNYAGLANYGNSQGGTVNDDYVVSRTGQFHFRLGVQWFSINHYVNLGISFEFMPNGRAYWSGVS